MKNEMPEMKTKVNIKKELITFITCLLICFVLEISSIVGYEKEVLEFLPAWQLDIMLGVVIYNFWTIFRLVIGTTNSQL